MPNLRLVIVRYTPKGAGEYLTYINRTIVSAGLVYNRAGQKQIKISLRGNTGNVILSESDRG